MGSLAVNLTASAPSGAVYRLRDATITVTDNIAPLVFDTEDDPSRGALSANVAVGDYTASLAAGWRLERVQGSSATTVEAALISANPATFRVNENVRTPVSFKFRTAAEEIDFAQGYDISLDVTEAAPHGIFISSLAQYGSAGGVGVFSRGAHDEAPPLRMIAGGATTLWAPSDLLVVGEQLIVLDSGVAAIDVFPRLASDTTPVRRIAGPSTGLGSPTGIAVSGNELFVAQGYGNILVFALDASGDVAPLRTITVWTYVPHLAVSQGEIYALEYSNHRIAVYPATASGDAVPTRVIAGSSTTLNYPTSIAVHGDELYVAQWSSALISVFDAAADGDTAPVRTFGSGAPPYNLGQIAIFGDELFAARASAIHVYPVNATGAVAPLRVLKGPSNLTLTATGVAVF